jgi:hypothetical protein
MEPSSTLFMADSLAFIVANDYRISCGIWLLSLAFSQQHIAHVNVALDDKHLLKQVPVVNLNQDNINILNNLNNDDNNENNLNLNNLVAIL